MTEHATLWTGNFAVPVWFFISQDFFPFLLVIYCWLLKDSVWSWLHIAKKEQRHHTAISMLLNRTSYRCLGWIDGPGKIQGYLIMLPQWAFWHEWHDRWRDVVHVHSKHQGANSDTFYIGTQKKTHILTKFPHFYMVLLHISLNFTFWVKFPENWSKCGISCAKCAFL
jgi:hypothetical protein